MLPPEPAAVPDPQETRAMVYRYHDGTKHHFQRFARSLGYLDWASQPRPFRGFAEAPIFPLYPAPGVASDGYAPERSTFDQVCEREDTAGAGQRGRHRRRAPARAGTLGVEGVQGVAVGVAREPVERQPPSDRSLRRVRNRGRAGRPAGGVPLRAGPARARTTVRVRRRGVARRRRGTRRTWCWSRSRRFTGAKRGNTASGAFRYCQHDLGHAIAAVSIAAGLAGWRAALLPAWSQRRLPRPRASAATKTSSKRSARNRRASWR